MKYKRQIVLLMIFMLFSVLVFSACDPHEFALKPNNNMNPPNLDNTISVPRIMSFNSYIAWDVVNYADEYEIYKNNVLIDTVKSNKYEIGKLTEDANFHILSKNTSGKSSQVSNEIVVSKNENFNHDEILNLSDAASFNGVVEPNIRKVLITKNQPMQMSFYCTIKNRIHDLIFELTNVKLNGSIKQENNNYSRLDNDYNLILEILGQCNIKSDDGFTANIEFEDNSEHDGIDGSDGDDAIIVPTVIIKGSGNLTVNGGDGGNGGKGASTTTWSDKTVGKGSDGGDGGNGIITQYFIINMESSEATIKVYGGKGGAKGSPGNNTSLVTGPLVSAMWADIYDIGKNGDDGDSVIGIINTLKGRLIRG